MRGNAQKQKGTGNPMQMLASTITTITKVLATIGLMPSPTKIHNESGMPIFLIPISYIRNAKLLTGKREEELALSTGKIDKKLVKAIKAESVESVNWWWYSPSHKGYPAKTKIIFLAGKETDTLETILRKLNGARGEVTKMLKGLELHDHTILCQKPDLYLKCERQKVKAYINAGQDEEETRTEQPMLISESSDHETTGRTQEELSTEVNGLKMEVKALKFHMATLVPLFEELRAKVKLDDTSSSS